MVRMTETVSIRKGCPLKEGQTSSDEVVKIRKPAEGSVATKYVKENGIIKGGK